MADATDVDTSFKPLPKLENQGSSNATLLSFLLIKNVSQRFHGGFGSGEDFVRSLKPRNDVILSI